MPHPRWWTLVATTAVWLTTVVALPAQGPAATGKQTPSHLFVQGNPAAAQQAESLLDSGLSAVPELRNLQVQKILRDFLVNQDKLTAEDRKQLEKLRDQAPKLNLDNPELQEWAKRLGTQVAAQMGKGRAPDHEQLTKLFLKQMQSAAAGKPAKGARSVPRPTSGVRPTPGSKERPPRDLPSHGPTSPPAEAPERQQMAKLAQQLSTFMERSGAASAFGKSPAWSRMLEGLNRFGQGGGSSSGPDGGASLFGSLGLDSRFGKLFSAETWSLPVQLPRPSLPSMARWLPSLPEGIPSWGAPQVGLPGAPSGGFWRGLLWIVLLLILGGALWVVLTRRKGVVALTEADEAWRPGPWPVPPGQVYTAADLVRAFEYLSLLSLGSEARSWHHHRIAAALAEGDGPADRRRAAFELAAVYEHARYAPAGHALSAPELDAARRDLCFLAGVSPA